jgi:transcriptional regulator with XRE-family HTH domain
VLHPGGIVEQKDDLAKMVGARLKDLRRKSGLSQKKLAQTANLSATLVCKIENGSAMPSIPTLYTLSNALKVNVGYFFQGEDEERGYAISLQGNRTQTVSERGYLAELLAEGMENPFMEPAILELKERDKEKEVTLVTHDGQEFLYVLEGRLELFLGAKRFLLKAGDAAYWNGTIPHTGVNVSKKRARTLNVHLIPGKRTGTFSSHRDK